MKPTELSSKMASPTSKEIHRYVDMWALPGVHPSNVEFLQRLKTADSNHFTKNMDVVGSVKEKDPQTGTWEKTHLIGVRTDVWKPNKREVDGSLRAMKQKRRAELKKEIKKSGRLTPQQSQVLENRLSEDELMQMQSGDVEKRRLVLKLFKTTGKRVRWVGTIEEVTVTEIHNSIGSKKVLLTMVVMLPRTDFVTYIQQNHRTFRVPCVFSFGYYDDRRMWHLNLKRRWVSAGPDFDVEADGKRIGILDGKLIGLGSDSYIDLDEHPLTGDTEFVDLLTLFTASVGYHKAMRRSVKRRLKALKAGQGHCHIVEDEELRLRHNGRAAA